MESASKKRLSWESKDLLISTCVFVLARFIHGLRGTGSPKWMARRASPVANSMNGLVWPKVKGCRRRPLSQRPISPLWPKNEFPAGWTARQPFVLILTCLGRSGLWKIAFKSNRTGQKQTKFSAGTQWNRAWPVSVGHEGQTNLMNELVTWGNADFTLDHRWAFRLMTAWRDT